MRIFKDRSDAGRQLAVALKQHEGTRALVLGIPRGGAEVAYQVAKMLSLEFSIIVVRKLPFPESPESGFGAIAEDGSLYFVPRARGMIERSRVDEIIQAQRAEVLRRVGALRKGRPLPDIRDRSIIVVDDGIAMGSTTQAAVLCCRNLGAQRVTVAAPVAAPDARAMLEASADEVVVLESPLSFRAVADYYQHWYDVPDEEVIHIMDLTESEAG